MSNLIFNPRYGIEDRPGDRTQNEITPAMVAAGLNVLRNWGGLEHPNLADEEIIKKILWAALRWREGVRQLSNLLPDFFSLLAAAYRASEAVDAYDLHSDNPESVKMWNALTAEQRLRVGELIRYTLANGNDLLQKI